jgi:anti-sigma-K factor RskA
MKYDNRELIEQLAAQYVLGTLRGRARGRFERLLDASADVQTAVRRWEDRLIGMAARVAVQAPPKHVWQGIERRLGITAAAATQVATPRRGFFAELFGSRLGLGALATAAVFVLAVGMLIQTNRPAPLQTIAVIAQKEQGELWLLRSTKDGQRIVVEATARVTPDAAHAFELWALPASGAAPVSLGVLPTNGTITLALNATQRAALGTAGKVAVSLEPPGGSPTGAPTGPVLHVADLTKLQAA